MSTATTTEPTALPTSDPDGAVRRALLADTAASSAVGVLLIAGHQVLDDPLGIPAGWLLGLGLFMVVYGVDVGLVGIRQAAPGTGVWHRLARAIPPLNGAWVVASIAVVLADVFDLTGLGTAFVLGQAAVVAGLAVVQQRALLGRAA